MDISGNFHSTKRTSKKDGTSNVYNTASIHKQDTSSTHRCALSVIEHQTISRKGGHPTEKPVDLYKFLIERYCPEGGTVLDPTFGSCNSGIAARDLGRKYIGIEKDKSFYDKALRLFSNEEDRKDNGV